MVMLTFFIKMKGTDSHFYQFHTWAFEPFTHISHLNQYSVHQSRVQWLHMNSMEKLLITILHFSFMYTCTKGYVVGVPKFTLRFDDLLEGFILIVTVYYSQKIQSKISKGKRSPGETRHKLPVFLCQKRHMSSAKFSQQWWVTTHTEYYQPGKLTQALVSRVFIGGCTHRHNMPIWRTLVTQASAPSEIKLLQQGQDPPPKITRLASTIWYGQGSPGEKDSFFRQDISRD